MDQAKIEGSGGGLFCGCYVDQLEIVFEMIGFSLQLKFQLPVLPTSLYVYAN